MRLLKNLSSLIVICAICFGCSLIDSARETIDGTKKTSDSQNKRMTNGENAANKTVENASVSPCQNRYYPVKDGAAKRYKNSIGNHDTQIKQQYSTGETSFTETLTIADITVKHIWQCTEEGLIAPNYGSGLDSSNMKLEPKHVSGVTLPKESELQVGKTWTVVYQATGTSEIGKVNAQVTVVNKIVSLDDEVKVPGGTFKALKVNADLDMDMKIGGNKISVPKIKSAAWFAPNVGMVKSGVTDGQLGNSTMEYAGDK